MSGAGLPPPAGMRRSPLPASASEDDLVAVAPAAAPVVVRGGESHRRPALDRDLLQHAVGEEADPPAVGGEERIRRSRRLRERLASPASPSSSGRAARPSRRRRPRPGAARRGRRRARRTGARRRSAGAGRCRARTAPAAAPGSSRSVGPSGPPTTPASVASDAAERSDPRREPPGPCLRPPASAGAAAARRARRATRASPMSRRRVRGSRSRQRRSSRRTPPACSRGQRRPVELARQDRREHVRHRLAVEEPLAGEHLEEHDAEGPDVGALVDGPAARLLGRHVGGGAEDEPGRGAGVGEGGRLRQVGGRAGARASAEQALARPKSRTLTLPSGVTLTLAGLRSRWTMPFSCASSRASAICFAMASASSTGIGPRFRRSARSSPSTSSMARRCDRGPVGERRVSKP